MNQKRMVDKLTIRSKENFLFAFLVSFIVYGFMALYGYILITLEVGWAGPWGLLHALLGRIPVFISHLLSPILEPVLLFIFGGYSGSGIDHLARGSLVCFIISLAVGLIIRPVIKNKAKCGAIMVGSPIFLTLLIAFLIPSVDPYFYIRSDVGGLIWLALLLLTPGALIIGAGAGVLVESFIKRYPSYPVYLVITFLLIITLFAGRIALTPTPTPTSTPPIHVGGVYINPPFQEAKAGEEVIVKVVVKLDSRVNEGEINLAFNPSAIQVVSIESGDFFGAEPLVRAEKINNEAGTLTYALARTSQTRVPTPGVFAIIKVKVVEMAESGTYDLRLTKVSLADENFQELDINVQGGSIKVSQQ